MSGSKKWLMGTDRWLRHEEATAKKQAILRALGIASIDIGFGPFLASSYSGDTLLEAFATVVRDLEEGIHRATFDGREVYVYRRKNAADIMTREEACNWFGEEVVARLDSLIEKAERPHGSG